MSKDQENVLAVYIIRNPDFGYCRLQIASANCSHADFVDLDSGFEVYRLTKFTPTQVARLQAAFVLTDDLYDSCSEEEGANPFALRRMICDILSGFATTLLGDHDPKCTRLEPPPKPAKTVRTPVHDGKSLIYLSASPSVPYEGSIITLHHNGGVAEWTWNPEELELVFLTQAEVAELAIKVPPYFANTNLRDFLFTVSGIKLVPEEWKEFGHVAFAGTVFQMISDKQCFIQSMSTGGGRSRTEFFFQYLNHWNEKMPVVRFKEGSSALL